MIALFGFVVNGTTDFFPLIDSFRLKRLGLTVLPYDSTQGFTSIGVRWQGDNAPDITETMLTGNTMPNHQSFRPYDASTAWFWHDQPSTNVALWELTLDHSGSTIILDIEIEYIINDGTVPSQGPLANPSTFSGIASRAIPIGSSNSWSPVQLHVA